MKFLLHQFCNKMVTALVVKHKKHLNKILTINIFFFFWKMKLLSEEVIENKVSEIQFWSLSVSPCLSLCLFLSLCLTLSLYSHPSPPLSPHSHLGYLLSHLSFPSFTIFPSPLSPPIPLFTHFSFVLLLHHPLTPFSLHYDPSTLSPLYTLSLHSHYLLSLLLALSINPFH